MSMSSIDNRISAQDIRGAVERIQSRGTASESERVNEAQAAWVTDHAEAIAEAANEGIGTGGQKLLALADGDVMERQATLQEVATELGPSGDKLRLAAAHALEQLGSVDEQTQKIERWQGTLSVANVEEVAQRVRQLLEGQRFVLVTACDGMTPIVLPNVRLDDSENGTGPAITPRSYGDSDAGIIVRHSRGAWNIGTVDFDRRGEQDAPHISIEPDQIVVTQMNPTGTARFVATLDPDDGK